MKLSKLLKRKKKNKALLLPPTNTNTNINPKQSSQDPHNNSVSPVRKNVPFVTTTTTYNINNDGLPVLEDDDDISAVTPATALPESPPREKQNPPISLLLGGTTSDDDSCSQDFYVFEDKLSSDDNNSYSYYGGSSSSQKRLTATTGFGSGGGGEKQTISSSLMSSGKLKVTFSDDAKYQDDGIVVVDGKGHYLDDDNYQRSTSNNNNNNIHTKKDTTPTATSSSSSTNKKNTVVANLIKRRSSVLTKTNYFKNAVNAAFDRVDVDKSGGVTLEELYAGLLLIHLKMAIFVGAPAGRPASKKYVTEVFHILDIDNSGTLDRQEFATAMQILYSQVFTRIVIQWTLTLILVPMTTKHIIRYTTLFLYALHEFWKDIDDELDPLQRLLWKLWESWLVYSPEALDQVGAIGWWVVCKIPWKSMPPVMLTVAQTSVALPWALNHVEDFFRRAAHVLVGRDDIASE